MLPEFAGVMVHDRLAMYFKYDKATHAICLAHVLRELEPIGIRWDQGWANDMRALLTEMNNAAHDARSTGATCWRKHLALVHILAALSSEHALAVAAANQPDGSGALTAWWLHLEQMKQIWRPRVARCRREHRYDNEAVDFEIPKPERSQADSS
ncbi:MAG: IS66 family transposase [Acidimicrobiales bacterium]